MERKLNMTGDFNRKGLIISEMNKIYKTLLPFGNMFYKADYYAPNEIYKNSWGGQNILVGIEKLAIERVDNDVSEVGKSLLKEEARIYKLITGKSFYLTEYTSAWHGNTFMQGITQLAKENLDRRNKV